jgi:ABC-2 type transport system ATP-binding protein
VLPDHAQVDAHEGRPGHGQVAHLTGVRRSEASSTATAFLRVMASRVPGEVPDLAVARPTLEDVYLRMIGEPA